MPATFRSRFVLGRASCAWLQYPALFSGPRGPRAPRCKIQAMQPPKALNQRFQPAEASPMPLAWNKIQAAGPTSQDPQLEFEPPGAYVTGDACGPSPRKSMKQSPGYSAKWSANQPPRPRYVHRYGTANPICCSVVVKSTCSHSACCTPSWFDWCRFR